jgi:hypothetical protein
MNKIVIWMLALFFVTGFQPKSWAADSKAPESAHWEIWTGSLANYTSEISAGNYTANFLGRNSELTPTLGYLLSDHWEVLVGPSFGLHGSGSHLVSFMFGGAYNFLGQSIRDHFFVKFYFGFDDMLDNRISDHILFTLKNWSWSASVGKRFELTPSVTFAPEVSYKWIKDSYQPITSLSWVPLQFSFLL